MDRQSRTTHARNVIFLLIALGETKASIEKRIGIATGTCRKYINGDMVPTEATVSKMLGMVRDVWYHRTRFIADIAYPSAKSCDYEAEAARTLHAVLFSGVQHLAGMFAVAAEHEGERALMEAQARQLGIEFPKPNEMTATFAGITKGPAPEGEPMDYAEWMKKSGQAAGRGE